MFDAISRTVPLSQSRHRRDAIVAGGYNKSLERLFGSAVMSLRATVFTAILLALSAAPASAAERAIVLDIDGVIGPAMADYVVRELHAATPRDVGIVILRMNTPGGLDTSMRQIDTAILASPVPVATYVAPGGARAASAGTYIAYASAIAAMAPGTNIGAATPIELGGNPLAPGAAPDQKPQAADKAGAPEDTETRKLVNDAVAYIKSLAAVNGRNADWAADAVRSADSIPASEALALHVVDAVAADVPDLLRQIDGRTVMVAGKPYQLATAGLDVVTAPPDWRTELLVLITNPNVAFILLLIGVYGLILEFFNPGAVAPGLVGAISLIVALYALALLPINYAGAALVLFGIGLMIAETHIGAFGAIGVGGIAAFAIGALMMFPSRVPGFALSRAVVLGAVIGSAVLLLLALVALARSRKRPVVTGGEALIGATGEAVAWHGHEGRVRVAGEIWRARADAPLHGGSPVKVLRRDGLILLVETIQPA
jgi:membrane-bound serine protease (ClpP class)